MYIRLFRSGFCDLFLLASRCVENHQLFVFFGLRVGLCSGIKCYAISGVTKGALQSSVVRYLRYLGKYRDTVIVGVTVYRGAR